MNFDFRKDTEKCDMIIQPPIDSSQPKKYTFRIGSSQDYLPIDWYKAYFHVTLDVKKKSDGTALSGSSNIALASDSSSLINSFKFESDSRQIYYATDINYATTTKNLMEMSNEYITTAGKRMFLYPSLKNGTTITKYTMDTTTNTVKSDNPLYNANYHKRMILTKSTIDMIIPLNCMEFFQSMKNTLIPPTKVEVTVDIEQDDILLYRYGGTDAKIVIKDIFLCYEKLTLSAANRLLYTKFLSSQQIINFYRESIVFQTSLKNREKNIILYETINKPRELFVWFSNTQNRTGKQSYDSFQIDTNSMAIVNATVVINDNIHVPMTPYNCSSRSIQAYNELLKYMTDKNKRESTFIDYELFKTKYMILYFDLKNNITDTLRNSYCKVEFKYILKDEMASEYTIYSLMLHEDQYKISLINGKSEIIK